MTSPSCGILPRIWQVRRLVRCRIVPSRHDSCPYREKRGHKITKDNERASLLLLILFDHFVSIKLRGFLCVFDWTSSIPSLTSNEVSEWRSHKLHISKLTACIHPTQAAPSATVWKCSIQSRRDLSFVSFIFVIASKSACIGLTIVANSDCDGFIQADAQSRTARVFVNILDTKVA
jgi:hypothetical protein